MKTLTGALALLAIVCWSFLCAGCWGGVADPRSAAGLAEAYKHVFRSLPPNGVQVLRARQAFLYDAESWWLHFEATPFIIDSYLTNGFKPIARDSFENETTKGDVPKWWDDRDRRMTAFYEASPWKTNFMSSRAYLAHDADKRTVWFKESCFN